MNLYLSAICFFSFIFSGIVFITKPIFASLPVSDSAVMAKSKQILKQLHTINFEKVTLIPVYDFTICEAENQLQQLQQQIKKENFTPKDTIRQWLDSAAKFTDIQRTAINQLLANIDDTYYKKALSYYNSKDTLNALAILEKAKNINRFFVPAYMLQARILLENKQYDSAIQIIDYIQNNTWRNDHTQIQYTQLQYAVYWTFLKDSEAALKNEDFNISINLLEKAKKYCAKKYIVCDEQLTNSLSKAHFGMFDSYLRVAQKASANSNMRFAEDYLLRAIQYREQYADMITITVNLDTLLNKIIDVYVQNGLQYIKINDYNNAMLTFEKIEQRCKKLSTGICNDNINNTIYAAKYSIYTVMLKQAENFIAQKNIITADSIINQARLFREKHAMAIPFTNELDTITKLRDIQWAMLNIESGKNYLYQNQIDSALNNFQNALFIAQFYHTILDSNLQQLFFNTTRQYLFYHLEEARLKAWGNKFDTAWQIFQKTEDFKNKKFLYSDETIDSTLQFTKQYIEQKHCNFYKNQLQQYLELAINSEKQNKFYNALLWLEKGKLLALHSPCYLDTTNLTQQQATIQIPATFQKMLFDAESLLQLKKLDAALQLYIEAKQQFTANDVGQWNISIPRFQSLIPDHYENKDLQNLLEKLNQTLLTAECIEIMKMLQQRGLKNSVIKSQMTQCAIIAAKQDFEKDNTQNPETNLKQYHLEDKWFKPFREHYKKTWGQLNKK